MLGSGWFVGGFLSLNNFWISYFRRIIRNAAIVNPTRFKITSTAITVRSESDIPSNGILK